MQSPSSAYDRFGQDMPVRNVSAQRRDWTPTYVIRNLVAIGLSLAQSRQLTMRRSEVRVFFQREWVVSAPSVGHFEQIDHVVR
jgi:hypothetical protein